MGGQELAGLTGIEQLRSWAGKSGRGGKVARLKGFKSLKQDEIGRKEVKRVFRTIKHVVATRSCIGRGCPRFSHRDVNAHHMVRLGSELRSTCTCILSILYCTYMLDNFCPSASPHCHCEGRELPGMASQAAVWIRKVHKTGEPALRRGLLADYGQKSLVTRAPAIEKDSCHKQSSRTHL